LTPGNIVGLLVLLAIPGFFLMRAREQANRESMDRAAIRPGMDLVEVFSAARNWTWAWAYTEQGETAPFTMTASEGTRVSFGEEFYTDWDSFIAAVVERKEELRPYSRWLFTYAGGPGPVKRSFSIALEDGKVTRVGDGRVWD
jgi:hypothetical protein